ncbi:MAG: MoxR family ATPase [Sedimenticola sp.]
MTTNTLYEHLVFDTEASPHDDPAQRLARRAIPPISGSLARSAAAYRPDPDLIEAVNVALATAQPLLITGEPGTGKTQLAYYLAHYFQINHDTHLYRLDVKSTTTHEALTYSFDAVAYLHAASDPKREGENIDKGEFVEEGVLWRAYRATGQSIVLIDEIDKAPRDFPNDLLRVLDEHSFYCRERRETVRLEQQAPPLTIITSNNERRLPDAFLRRCTYHHIDLSEALVKRAVGAHLDNPDFPDLEPGVHQAAINRFLELRERQLNKAPSLGELLVWLAVLAAKEYKDGHNLSTCPLGEMPGLNTLIKDWDDRNSLV